MKVAILGLGNILLGDEGAGVRAVEVLKESFDFPECVDIIDGGTMGLDLLTFIKGKDRILIIDAIDFGMKPGTITTIGGSGIPAIPNAKISTHQIGLSDVLCMAKLVGITPVEAYLIGIQPATIEAGTELSFEVNKKFSSLIGVVVEKLKDWGIELKEKGEM